MLSQANRELCQKDLLAFVKAVDPNFVIEEVHITLAAHLEAVMRGEILRLQINMPPRIGKSRIVSELFPAWYMGNRVNREILMASHSSHIGEGFSSSIQEICKNPVYGEIFPEFEMLTHNQTSWTYRSRKGHGFGKRGIVNVAGVQGRIAGKGFHLGIIDDPISEQQAMNDKENYSVNRWFGIGFGTRRMSVDKHHSESSAIIVIMTRWRSDDLIGHLDHLTEMAKSNGELQEGEEWTKLIIPAFLKEEHVKLMRRICEGREFMLEEYDGKREFMVKVGGSLSPRRWSEKELKMSRNMIDDDDLYNALYMQTAIKKDGNILKRTHWRRYPDPLPVCSKIIQCWDTAIEANENSDYSACTTWGVFFPRPDKDNPNPKQSIILLHRWKGRIFGEELPEKIGELAREYKADRVYIEKRATGAMLVRQVRKALPNVKVVGWLPRGGGRKSVNKINRAHLAAIPFGLGNVYHVERNWVKEVIDDCASFPHIKHDDIVDSVTMALLILQNEFWVRHITEADLEDSKHNKRKRLRGRNRWRSVA